LFENLLPWRLGGLAALPLLACSAEASPPASTASVTVSEVVALRGVPDRGMDPAVVAIEVGESGVCTGVLIAPDVVLTARHCTATVSADATCPARGPQVVAQLDPASLHVLMGDSVGSALAVAQGLDVFVPGTDVLCGADIALVLLDRPVTTVTPAIVAGVGVAKGQHVRTVGYGGSSGEKLLREHVPVIESEASELVVGESPCIGAGGAPAFSESTGHVVGVLARFGPCDGATPYDVYTRADVFYPLVEQALASSVDAGKKQSTTDTKDPTDLGGACFTGADCGAGVCIDTGSSEYCSEACSATDKCPTDYKCVLMGGDEVCVQS
jgi:hypothetical protein